MALRFLRPQLPANFDEQVMIDYFKHYAFWQMMGDVSNLLFHINCAMNPLVYFLFTKNFRDLRVRGFFAFS